MRPLLLLVLLLGSGCATFSPPLSARTLDAGQVQLSTALSVQRAEGLYLDSLSPTVPIAELGARYGLSDRVELGAKLHSVGAELSGRFALARPPSHLDGWNISLEPSVSGFIPFYFAGGPADAVLVPKLTTYFGRRINGHELLIGPTLANYLYLGDGNTAQVMQVGGTVAYSAPVGARSRLGGFVSVHRPLRQLPGTHDVDVLLQGGLGFEFAVPTASVQSRN